MHPCCGMIYYDVCSLKSMMAASLAAHGQRIDVNHVKHALDRLRYTPGVLTFSTTLLQPFFSFISFHPPWLSFESRVFLVFHTLLLLVYYYYYYYGIISFVFTSEFWQYSGGWNHYGSRQGSNLPANGGEECAISQIEGHSWKYHVLWLSQYSSHLGLCDTW